ncbi:MAG: bifunctional UDP-sugar hydrolase/5'-nucleotidase [Candidatus Calescibacterium sp.]|nr:bifunctional metallophosphatase/5'-nucleotidase [Candidatus Calescibacterium sp.]MCX7971825.1 bifunctional metallophosphatase/5'-nucleotidase [bacterium]MDW8194940.1 bifunctional UDP-sugar hydrolase/5'-nucleotidase [Candidatus Calescibacterium sp.]
MIRIVIFVFSFILFVVLAKEINIIHINDFHGRLVPQVQKIYGGYSYTVAGAEYLSSLIDSLRKNNENVFLFDAGDFSAGTIYSNLSQGMSVVEFYNYLGFDAVAIGNHEFDFGFDAFKKLVKSINTNVLCANAYPLFDNTKPFVILDKYGVKLAVLGLLTPDTKIITMPSALGGREILDPIQTLNSYRNDILKYSPDLVIVLSHCGVKVDENIARNVDYIDLIIGGHSHTELFEPIIIDSDNKKKYIVQAGAYGKYVGHVKIRIQNKKIANFEYKLYPTINAILSPDRKVTKVIQNYLNEANTYSSRIIGKSEVTMDKENRDKNLNLGIFITNVFAHLTSSDIALYNHGGIRDVLHKGDITYGQIFNILPFENTLLKIKMKGKDILEMLNNTNKKKTRLYYNQELEYREGKWYLKGREIEEEKYYTVATVDFLYYGGDGYNEFSRGIVVENYGYARELLVEYIKNNSPIKGSNILLIHR